jgi:signal transduction histidine kinase
MRRIAVNSRATTHPTGEPVALACACAEPGADAGPDPVLRRLAASLAHNVNNALTGVIGYLELALSQAPPDGELSAHLNNSLNCAFRAAAAVRQIVTYASRPSSPETLAVLSLREIAQRVLERFTPILLLNVKAEIVGESAGWVQGNAGLLECTLDQLVANALEAMPDGGTLTLHLHEEGESCSLSVSDTGPGIAAEAIPHLFEPFATTKPSGHLGLGLALCRNMVLSQRGRLQVASLAGQGATVTLTLPSVRKEGERVTGS